MTPTDKQELLPCPFCGGKVNFCGEASSNGCDGCHFIECRKCGYFDFNDDSETLLEARVSVSKLWNTRQLPDQATDNKDGE